MEIEEEPVKKNLNRGSFGLFSKKAQLEIPLKNISYQTEIDNSIAKTTISQLYLNDANEYIETEYLFPVEINACFNHFEVRFQDQVIEGIIKEKEEAKEEYKINKEHGNTVAYSEINKDAPDIMKIQIGNIPPKTEIRVIYSYLQELEVALNSFWRYAIPSTLTPRYHQSIDNKQSNENINITTMSQHSPAAYTWSIKIYINASSKIDKIDSPSHKIQFLEKNEDETKIVLIVENIGNQILPNKDFVLLLQNEAIRFPSVTLGRNPKNEACAMISFVPNFANCQMDDAIKQSLENTHNFPVEIDQARGEYIFLIDRSGSMGGQRIIQAKQALILFLKSLPTESLFNIISFGSDFELMFPKSVKYESQKLNLAIKQVENFNANFGGTEIYTPLQEIFKKPRNKGYPRQIFLLTDGCVSDEKSVIQLIKANNQYNRVHAIGIGNGTSQYLIKQSAKYGKGVSSFVTDNQPMSGQIISILERSLTPCLDNFVFKYNQDAIDLIIPTPSQIPCFTKNEPFYLYIFFKPGVENLNTEFEISCYDSCLNTNLTFPILINSETAKFRNEVFQLGMNRMIKCLEDEAFIKERETNDIFSARLENLSSQLVNLSVSNQIISTKTAFICIVKSVSDEMTPQIQQQQKIQKIIVPQIESIDYSIEEKVCYKKKAKCKALKKNVAQQSTYNNFKRAHAFKRCISPKFEKCDIIENVKEFKLSKGSISKGSIQKVNKMKTQDTYQLVIDEFQLEGYWKMNQQIVTKIAKKFQNFDQLIPPEIKKLNKLYSENIWATILILMWLQLKYDKIKSEWVLIEKKVLNWLRKGTNDEWVQFKEIALSQLQ